jgi:hypothetical protein
LETEEELWVYVETFSTLASAFAVFGLTKSPATIIAIAIFKSFILITSFYFGFCKGDAKFAFLREVQVSWVKGKKGVLSGGFRKGAKVSILLGISTISRS